MAGLQFLELTADVSGLESQLQDELPNVQVAFDEQESGRRKRGKVTLSFELSFTPQGSGTVLIRCEGKLKQPARISGDSSVVAHIQDGVFVVLQSEQEELPFNVVPMTGTEIPTGD